MRTIKYYDIGLVLTKHDKGQLYNVSRETFKKVTLFDVIKNLTSGSRHDKAEYFVAWSGLKYQRMTIVNVLAKMGYTYIDGATKKQLHVGDFRGRFTQGKCFYLQIKTAKAGYVTLQAVETVIGSKRPAQDTSELKSMLDLYHYTRRTFLDGLKRSETRILYSSSSISRTMYNRKHKAWNFTEGSYKKTYVKVGSEKIKKNVFIESYIRPCVHGGYNNMDPRASSYKGDGIVLDINSLYPYIASHKTLPSTYLIATDKGAPDRKYIRHKESFYTFLKVTVSATLKRDGLACILPDNTLFSDSHYLTTMTKRKLTLSEADRALLFDNYDITYYRIDSYMIFRASRTDFRGYISDLYGKKAQATGIERDFYKSMLNGLIGTFAKQVYKDEYYLDMEEGYYILKKRPVDEQAYKEALKAVSGLSYLNVAVVSEARKYIISYIKKHKERWLYTDTDSLHLSGKEIPGDIPVSDMMGDFKLEHDFETVRYYGVKKYIMTEHGHIIPTIAGLPKDTFEDIGKTKGIDTAYINKALAHKDLDKLASKPIGIYDIVEDIDTETIAYHVRKGWLNGEVESKKNRKQKQAEKKRKGWEYYTSKGIDEKLYETYGLRQRLKHFAGKWNRAIDDGIIKKPTFDQAVEYMRSKMHHEKTF